MQSTAIMCLFMYVPIDSLVEAETCSRNISDKCAIYYGLCNLLSHILYNQSIA